MPAGRPVVQRVAAAPLVAAAADLAVLRAMLVLGVAAAVVTGAGVAGTACPMEAAVGAPAAKAMGLERAGACRFHTVLNQNSRVALAHMPTDLPQGGSCSPR